ncbi:MAG: hypothetical protein ACO1SV_08570 [Fimbriimonas sp.]
MSEATVRTRKRMTLAPRELYFATYHQAAHAVVATMLGCGVDRLDIGMQPEEVGWNPDAAPSGDFETVCAAGYAMELLLGRRPEVAWRHCQDDLAILTRISADRTGTPVDPEEASARFIQGGEQGRAILGHPSVRAAIDRLAESLGDAYLAHVEGLTDDDVRATLGPLHGADVVTR